ncbi:MAG: recombination regulator RecX [Chlorobi bacterium]|nr:recombination regulator RecX [Chlorobiota bacterium]
MEEHAINKATAYALKLLARRSHSRFELQEKLLRKGFGKGTVEDTLERLVSKKLIDDAAFGSELIATLSRRKPAGRKVMRYELMRKGVPDEIADDLLKECDSQELCRRAGMKKLASMKGGSEAVRKKKLEVFLRNRGFEWPAIKEILEDLFQADLGDETDDVP